MVSQMKQLQFELYNFHNISFYVYFITIQITLPPFLNDILPAHYLFYSIYLNEDLP